MPVIERSNVIAGARLRSAKPSAIYEYDFAVDGGVVGSIPMRAISGGGPTPSGATILDTILDVLTVLTGATATAAVQTEAANDVVAAAAISGAPWSTTGRKAGIPVSAATSVKTTAARTPTVVVGTANLTAGKFRLYVEYLDPNVG